MYRSPNSFCAASCSAVRSGSSRPDGADPPRGYGERLLLLLLDYLLPPHADNVAVLRYLDKEVDGGKNPHVAFCAVRPSDMHDTPAPSPYTVHATLQNGIFKAGSTTRANVGEVMANLVTKPDVWSEWKNSYPQILDVSADSAKSKKR